MPYKIIKGKQVPIDPMTGQPFPASDQEVYAQTNGQQTQGKKPSILDRLASALVKPAVKYTNMVGGAGYELFRAGKSALGDKNAYVNQKTNKVVENPFLNQEEIETFSDPRKGVVEGAKRTAGMASYFVPAGKLAKGAGVGAKVLQGAAVGAKTGGLYGFSESKKNDLEGMAIDTVKGAVTGGVTGGALGAVGGVASKFKGAKLKNQKAVLNPKVGETPDFIQQGDELTQELSNRGLIKNNSEDTARTVGEAYRGLTEEISPILEKSVKTKSWAREETMLRKKILEEGKYFVPGDPTHERLLNKYINLVKKNVVNGKVNAKAVYEGKNTISSKLGKAFDKEDDIAAAAITDAEGVGLDMWRAMDDIVTDIEPSLKGITKEMSFLHQAKTGLKKVVEKSGQAKVFGLGVGPNINKSLQNVSSGVANTASAIGGIPGAIPGAAKSAVIKGGTMLGVNGQQPQEEITEIKTDEDYDALINKSLTGLQTTSEGGGLTVVDTDPNGEWQTMSDGKSYSMDGKWVFDEQADDWIENTTPIGGGEEINPEAPMSKSQYNETMAQLAQSNSTAAVRQYGLLEQERDYYYPEAKEGGKLTEADKKFALGVQEAEKALTLLQTKGDEINLGPVRGSGIGKRLREFTGKQSGTEAAFNSQVSTARTAVRNALLGANMSDKEMESLLDAMFDTDVPKNVMENRLKAFIDSYSGYINNIASQGGGATEEDAVRNYMFSQEQ